MKDPAKEQEQAQRQEEREQLREMIQVKYGSVRRFCDIVGYKYSKFRRIFHTPNVSDLQIKLIREAYNFLMSMPNQKLDTEITVREINLIWKAMRTQGVSQNKMSKELGVARTTLGDLLRGDVKKKTDLYHRVTNYLRI